MMRPQTSCTFDSMSAQRSPRRTRRSSRPMTLICPAGMVRCRANTLPSRDTNSARSTGSPRGDNQEGSWSAESRSEEHTSELQSLMRISYAVFCLKKKIKHLTYHSYTHTYQHVSVT